MNRLRQAAGRRRVRWPVVLVLVSVGLMPGTLRGQGHAANEAAAKMTAAAGFEVSLVAAEPLVMDPVAFDWGPDGKLWVAEMADYPTGIDGKGTPGGRVRFLEDTNGDGRYDKSTVFLDGLAYPNSVMAWRDGVLVCSAPDLIYAQDTDNDGRAATIDFAKVRQFAPEPRMP